MVLERRTGPIINQRDAGGLISFVLPAFRATKQGSSTDQTGIVSGVKTLVIWNIVDFDDPFPKDTFNLIPTHDYVPSESGKYIMTATIRWLAPVDQASFRLNIEKNGVAIATEEKRPSGTGDMNQTVETLTETVGGGVDSFRVTVLHTGGGSQTILASTLRFRNAFEGFRIYERTS